MPEINTIGENAFKDTKINTAFFSKLTTINSSAFENTGISNIYCVVNENGQLKYTYPDSNEIQSQLINLSILEGFNDNGSPILNLNKNTLYIQLNEINEPISIGQNAFREAIIDSADNKMNLYLSPNLKIDQGAFYNRRIQSLYFTNDLIDSNDEDYIANLEISTGAFYNCIFEDDEATKRLKIQLPSGQGHFKINENAFFFIDSENLPEEIIVIVNDVDLEDSTSNYYLHPKAFQKNGTEIEFSIKIDNANADTKNKIIEQCNKYDHISII